MNPVHFALRHPITMMMVVVALIGGGALAIDRMRVDIFPPFDLPQIYVIQNFNGMSPAQMEGLIVNQFELNFQYVDGVKNVESKQHPADRADQAVVLSRHRHGPGDGRGGRPGQPRPGLHAAGRAAAADHAHGCRQRADRLPGADQQEPSRWARWPTWPSSASARWFRPTCPARSAPRRSASNVRSIVVNVDPDRLRTYNLTPDDVVTALTAGNVITPAGNLYIKDQMPLVPIERDGRRASRRSARFPLQPGRNVYIRDVATIADGTDVNFGYALVNGRRSVYIPIVKKNTASTLPVVSDIHRAMPMFKSVLPEGVDISYEFDESPTVVEAIRSVATEGLIGATLTGLMILLFLHDWRSVIVVVFNIPMALLGSLLALWLTGNTINIMTLGGLALSIGMLVDEATVSIENIHVQMDADRLAGARRRTRQHRNRRRRACWPCCAFCRCSSPPSSWPSRCVRCSCRWRWRSASP